MGSGMRFLVLLACSAALVASNCLTHFFDDEAYSSACQTRDDAGGRTAEECQRCVQEKWDSSLKNECPSQNQLNHFCIQSARMHVSWRADPSKKPKKGLHVRNKTRREQEARRLAEQQQKQADVTEKNRREAQKEAGSKRAKREAARAKKVGTIEVAADGSSTPAEGVQKEDQSNQLEQCLNHFFRDLPESAGCQNRDNIDGVPAKKCKACVRASWKKVLKPNCKEFKKKMLIKFCDQAIKQHKLWVKQPDKKPKGIQPAVAPAWEPASDDENLDVQDADELEPDLQELDDEGKPVKQKIKRMKKTKKTKRKKQQKKNGGKQTRRQHKEEPSRKSVGVSGDTEEKHSNVEDQSEKLETCLSFFFRDHGDASAGCQNRDEWLSPGVPSPSKDECQACVRAKWSTHLSTPCDIYEQSMLESFCQQAADLHAKWRADPASKRQK